MGVFFEFSPDVNIGIPLHFFSELYVGDSFGYFQKLIWVPLLNFLEVYVGIFFEFSPEVYMCISPEFFKRFVGYVPFFNSGLLFFLHV